MLTRSFEPQLYAVMRIVFGVMFFTYGLAKIGLLGDPAARGEEIRRPPYPASSPSKRAPSGHD